jgi:lipoyl-dependent peroxiredoxin subunit C
MPIRAKPAQRFEDRRSAMKTVGQKIEKFNVVGVKPGFNQHEENGVSAFEPINEQSFAGKWKVIYFYPKDFTFVCPTEIVGFAKLAGDFADRDAVVLGGSTDNEFAKLGWRRDHKDLTGLNHWQFADTTGSLVDQLGVRDATEGVALRATFVVDPDNVIQHVSVNNLNVGRNPEEVLRILDGLQTDELCPCNRKVGGNTL